MSNSYRYKISLRVTHPVESAVSIAKAIGLQPKILQTVGEQRKTPTGLVLGGFYQKSYCNFPIDIDDGDSLLETIEKTSDKLSSCSDFLNTINSSGGKVEFFIGFFFDSTSGEELDHSLLSKITALGISLSLNLYCEGKK